MARPELGFDVRDLPAAALDSCGPLPALLADLLEGPSIALELRLLPAERLPPLDDDVDVLRVQLHPAADPFRQLRGSEGRAAAEERLVNQLAALGVVQDGAAHQ